MSLGLYMDVHVRQAITRGLRARGVEVLTAQEDGARRFEDPDLLDRATDLGRVLFSNDEDLLVEANQRIRMGAEFSTVIYAHLLYVPIGRCIEDLEFFAKAALPHEAKNQVVHLPLK